jgi:hypothetical protein
MKNPSRWQGCRIMKAQLNNHSVLYVENSVLRVGINVDKGAEIFEFRHKPSDVDAMWHRDSVAAELPAVPQTTPNGLDAFFDQYTGGWQESFPVGNSTGLFGKAHMYLHGEVSLVPWQYSILEDSASRISVEFAVYCRRTPFLLRRRISMEEDFAFIRLDEVVTNMGRQPLPYVWGHHPAFGPPLLGEGARLDLPRGIIRTVTDSNDVPCRFQSRQQSEVPRLKDVHGELVDLAAAPGPDLGTFDDFEIELHDAGRAAIRNPSLDLGVGIVWDAGVFPYLWVWEVSHALSGYPLWGRDYLVAVEPFNCPVGGITEPDVAPKLPQIGAGESRDATLAVGWCRGGQEFTGCVEINNGAPSWAAWLRR